jgi:hypothetical protein
LILSPSRRIRRFGKFVALSETNWRLMARAPQRLEIG